MVLPEKLIQIGNSPYGRDFFTYRNFTTGERGFVDSWGSLQRLFERDPEPQHDNKDPAGRHSPTANGDPCSSGCYKEPEMLPYKDGDPYPAGYDGSPCPPDPNLNDFFNYRDGKESYMLEWRRGKFERIKIDGLDSNSGYDRAEIMLGLKEIDPDKECIKKK